MQTCKTSSGFSLLIFAFLSKINGSQIPKPYVFLRVSCTQNWDLLVFYPWTQKREHCTTKLLNGVFFLADTRSLWCEWIFHHFKLHGYLFLISSLRMKWKLRVSNYSKAPEFMSSQLVFTKFPCKSRNRSWNLTVFCFLKPSCATRQRYLKFKEQEPWVEQRETVISLCSSESE